MKVSNDELNEAGIDVGFRDFCAHLLIPLNKCRRETKYAPWKCEHERHTYEKCQYEDYLRRIRKLREQHVAEGKLVHAGWGHKGDVVLDASGKAVPPAGH